ncbi:MAG: hypothetical protein U0174_21785 [Polyangiaceae bacterium]
MKPVVAAFVQKLLGPPAVLGVVLALQGCAGHEAKTLKMRTALDAGDTKAAIASLNDELGVGSDRELPRDLSNSDRALLLLDRATIQQSRVAFDLSKHDFEASDKAIDMLDLSHGVSDDVAAYMFSDSAGRYRAPPYEKFLINTLNMLNYLETHDASGARVESRRFEVMRKYLKDSTGLVSSGSLSLGAAIAGFTCEINGETDEALRYYDEAIADGRFPGLGRAILPLIANGSYKSPRLKALVAAEEAVGVVAPPPKDAQDGDIFAVVGYGRVPHKIPQRIPIGLALTMFSGSLSPTDRARANEIAAQGLVTWVNFPTLAPSSDYSDKPTVLVDGHPANVDVAIDLDREVRAEWKKLEGPIIVKSITRMITRFAVGQGLRIAAGKNEGLGIFASLAAQATMTALDTPDTRSWESLPARVAVARIRVPAGAHKVELEARGMKRAQAVKVETGGWSAVTLMALR